MVLQTVRYSVFEDRVGAKGRYTTSHLTRTVAWALKPTFCKTGHRGISGNKAKLFVGVDISRASLDVAMSAQTDIITFSNDQSGVDALVKKPIRMDPELTFLSLPVVMSFWQLVCLSKPWIRFSSKPVIYFQFARYGEQLYAASFSRKLSSVYSLWTSVQGAGLCAMQ